MDKLKNIMNPGAKKDDEVMYGSGVSDDPVHSGSNTVSGEGSHFGSSRTAGSEPLTSTTNQTTTGTAGLREPHSSRMPGSFDDDAATTASVKSGILGHSQSGSNVTGVNEPGLNTNKALPREPATAGTGLMSTGSSTTAGPHSSSLANKADPRVDSNFDGSRGLGSNTTTGAGSGLTGGTTTTGIGSGLTGGSTSTGTGSGLTGSSLPDRTLGSSVSGNQSTGSSHLERDAALGTGAIGADTAAHHHQHHGGHDTGRSFPLGGISDTTTGSGYASGQTGTYPAGGRATGSSTAGPHSSSLANKADPRVDSNLDGSRTTGTTGLGSSTSGFGSGTGPSASSHNQGSLGRDAGTGAGGVGAATSTGAGFGSDRWQHQHGTHGHQYTGDPCGPETAAPGAPHFTSGPHATDTANRLDPRVASGVGSSSATTGTSTGSGLESSSAGHHGARDAGLAAGAGAAGVGGYEASQHNAGSTATGPAPTTAGPHKSDMLNKLDPRVDSDLSKQQGTSGTGLGSSSTGTGLGSSDTTGSTTAGGLGSSTTGSSNTGGLGSSSTRTGLGSSTTGTGLGSSTTGSSDPYSSTATGRDHTGRNAGLAGAGAGIGGAGAYEAAKHHRSHDTTTGSTLGQTSHSPAVPGTTGSSTLGGTRNTAGSGYDPQAGTGHHYGRDAGLVGAGGVGAYEADKHLGSHDRSAPQDRLAGSGHQPTTTTTTTSTTAPHHHLAGHERQQNVASHAPVGTDTGRDPSHQTAHHGRDAALAGGVGAGAGGAAYEAEKMRTHGYADPGANVREHQGTAHPSVATYPSPGYGNESARGTGHQGTHTGRDAALAGGAGAGAGAVAGHEYSKKEAEKLQKEHAREEKALEKEHHKEQKHHDKELAKEEKHHEKVLAAEEKKHEKHHDDHGRHEKHDGEKKHGGLLGLLHRDKPDPELKEEEAQRRAGAAGPHYGRGEEEMAGGAGAIGLEHRTPGTGLEGRQGNNPLAGEHGSQSGVHDTPIGSGSTTHDAYGTTGGHNKLHKDPPARVLENLGHQQGHQQ